MFYYKSVMYFCQVLTLNIGMRGNREEVLACPGKSYNGQEIICGKGEVMDVSIEYCGTCNYRPMAARLAKSIEEATGIKVLLIHSRVTGAFEVRAGEETIYSKMASGHFPDYEGITEIVRARQAAEK